MGNYELIQGQLNQLNLEASKIYAVKNKDSKVATSALIGALTGSTTAITSAPLLLMIKNEFDAFTLRAKIYNNKIEPYRVCRRLFHLS